MIMYLIMIVLTLVILLSAVIFHMLFLASSRVSGTRLRSDKLKRTHLDDVLFN
jgi:hypothetical protein